MWKLETRMRNIFYRLKGVLLTLYLLLHGCEVGRGLKCKQFPAFRSLPCKNMVLGNYVNVGFRITFDPAPNGTIVLGDHVNITQDIIISAKKLVEIGDYSQIAEFVSIRDADHSMRKGALIVSQGHESLEIRIGRDVWLGAGARILKGARIPDGAVVGANSLITATSQLEPYSIYAGTPARFIRMRV